MNPRQIAFARNYAEHQNVAQAAREAGYSESYSRSKAKYLLDNPDVLSEIKRLRTRMNEQADKSAVDVVNELANIAFTDRIDFLKPDPEYPDQWTYKAPDELTKEQRAIVEKTLVHNIFRDGKDGKKVFVKQVYNYVFCDKAKALDQMGRHFGIFDDKLKITAAAQNPFANATPAQLEALKKSWVGVMNDPKLIEGEYEEVNGSGKK